jgi:GPI mannosyltransferase 4
MHLTRMVTSSNTSWILYFGFLIIRIGIGSFLLLGYLHPDEFFQGGQELFWGCPSSFPRSDNNSNAKQIQVPWEFETQNAVRSILPPMIMTRIPLWIYSWMWQMDIEKLNGIEILIIPRFLCGLLSLLTVDMAVYRLTYSMTDSSLPSTSMWILATSWVSWVILNRPFTNALETMCLAMVMVVANEKFTSRTGILAQSFLLGALCSLGTFVRFTFVFFAFSPICMFYFRHVSLELKFLGHLMAFTVLAFLLTSSIIIMLDTMYYDSDSYDFFSFVTPWNAFSYNSKTENLAKHGLHPRWTHAIVNMFILFGPMALVYYTNAIKILLRCSSGKASLLENTCTSTILCALLCLSLAPHQEPRFLTPLLLPLVILMRKSTLWSSKIFRIAWVTFNFILMAFFGVLHQGGIIPTLLSNNILLDNPKLLFFSRTYMPPTFLMRRRSRRQSHSDSDNCPITSCPQETTIIDLQLCKSTIWNTSGTEAGFGSPLHLIQTHLYDKDSCLNTLRKLNPKMDYTCELVWNYWPHLSTEDFLRWEGSILTFINDFRLNTYKLESKIIN